MKIGRAFIAAVLGAGALVAKAPKDINTWITGVGIVAAAATGSVKRREPNVDRTRHTDTGGER